MENQSKFEISSGNTITKKNKKDKVTIKNPPKLSSEEYHKEELKQNKMIVKNAIFMIWVGIFLIIASFIVYVLGLTDTLTAGTICGCFIDIFSGTILFIFNKSNENKQNYFQNLSNNENEERIIKLVETINDDNLKLDLTKKLINKHYQK